MYIIRLPSRTYPGQYCYLNINGTRSIEILYGSRFKNLAKAQEILSHEKVITRHKLQTSVDYTDIDIYASVLTRLNDAEIIFIEEGDNVESRTSTHEKASSSGQNL